MYKYNGLKVTCDWLDFTVDIINPYEVMNMFGLVPDMFQKMQHGSLGYSGMFRCKNAEITVLYDGAVEMGVHLQVKGSAISCFLDFFRETLKDTALTPWGMHPYNYKDFADIDNLFKILFEKICENGWITRLDLALDDVGVNYYSCKQVHNFLKKGEYVSRVKCWDVHIPHNRSGEETGYTVYLGSPRNSRMFLRVYDKKLEQKNDDLPDWVRWEVVLKDERAQNFANYIISGMDFAGAVAACLNSMVRFINLTSSNRSYCKTKKKWEKLIGEVGKLKLTTSKSKRTVDTAADWINRQCAPTIAGLVAANGGSIDFLTKNLNEHFERLSAKDKEMFLNYFKGDDENEPETSL